jgi:bile acid-coenzyme A ligase
MRDEPSQITIGERIGQLAERHPDAPAIAMLSPEGATRTLTWSALERGSNRAAHALEAHGVTADSILGVALEAGFEHAQTTLGAWKLGACVVPLNASASERERRELRSLLGAQAAIVGEGSWATIPTGYADAKQWSDEPLAPRGTPRSASASGGSAGAPRIVMRQRAWQYPQDDVLTSADRATGLRCGQIQLVVLPMHHAGFTALHHGLALDHTIVWMERFVPQLVPRVLEQLRVNHIRIVPSLMRLLLDVPELRTCDRTSVESMHHGAGPCSERVKRAWLELFDPATVFEDYSSVERLGVVTIRGDEWLRRPGSVGRPTTCDVRIVTDDGRDARSGEVGEIFLRSPTTRQPEYVGGGPALRELDGFLTLGDLGRLDEHGYLYLVGRASDVINVGGVNVHPAEVEGVLLERAEVGDAAVVARANEYLGEALHALIVPATGVHAVDVRALDSHCRRRLSLEKVPLSYELVDALGRTAAGKLRRSLLSVPAGD